MCAEVLFGSIHRLVAVLSISFLFAGCAGVHLYNEESDKTATAIKDKQEKIDIEKVFKTEGENLTALLADEIAVRNNFIDQVRARRLWRFVYEHDPLATLVPRFGSQNDYVARRLKKLGISDRDTLEQATTVHAVLDGVLMNSESLQKTVVNSVGDLLHQGLRDFGWAEPYECPVARTKTVDEAVAEAKPTQASKNIFRDLYAQYKKHCETIFSKVVEFNKLYGKLQAGTLLHDAYDQYKGALAERTKVEDEEEATRDKLPKKKKDTEKTTDHLAEIQKKAGEIAESLKDAQEFAKLLGAGKVLSEERVSALSLLLTSFSGGTLPDLSVDQEAVLAKNPGLHRAAIIAAGLPGIAGDVKKLRELMADPGGRAGLALQLGHQQQKLAYLKTQIALINARAQLSADLLRARLQEAAYFRDAQHAVTNANRVLVDIRGQVIKAAKKIADGSLTAAQETAALKAANVDFTSVADLTYRQIAALPRSKVKRLAVSAIIEFDMSISVARRRADVLYFRLLDVRHREVVEADAFAARAWRNLLDGPIQQIQAYHASGIKQEVIAKLISDLVGLGLLGFIAAEAK